jgi:ABC-type multidrug transport system ATPase subunit
MIDEPSIYVVLGPNGAGKTTLFRTIAGILEPYSGEVLFDGENVTSSRDVRKQINYLSHYNALPEEMTVYSALAFYANVQGGSVDEVLELLQSEGAKQPSD